MTHLRTDILLNMYPGENPRLMMTKAFSLFLCWRILLWAWYEENAYLLYSLQYTRKGCVPYIKSETDKRQVLCSLFHSISCVNLGKLQPLWVPVSWFAKWHNSIFLVYLSKLLWISNLNVPTFKTPRIHEFLTIFTGTTMNTSFLDCYYCRPTGLPVSHLTPYLLTQLWMEQQGWSW